MKEFTAHGYLGLSNVGGLEIEINDSGDAARLRDTVSNEITDWLEIEYRDTVGGDIFHYVSPPWGGTYSLGEFLRV